MHDLFDLRALVPASDGIGLEAAGVRGMCAGSEVDGTRAGAFVRTASGVQRGACGQAAEVGGGSCCRENERKEMSGRTSREKGRRAEIELFRLLSDELGFVVRRNVDQARQGGADGMEVPGFAIECKRCETVSLPKWWRQAVKQGEAMQSEPIVFYRKSREPWRALVRTVDGGYRLTEWDAAVMHIREKIARLHAIYLEAA